MPLPFLRHRFILAPWPYRLQALLGLALILDTLILLAFRRTNAGAILPGFLGVFMLWRLWNEARIAAWRHNKTFDRLWRLGRAATYAWLLSLAAFFALIAAQPAARELRHAPDYLIVLGAGLIHSEPTPMLQKRLEVAFELARSFPASRIVVSGGQGPDETRSEAEAMREGLLALGLPASRILNEDRSRNSSENLRFSRTLIEADGGSGKTSAVAIVTSDFHVLRVARLARHIGLERVELAPSPTPISIRLNAWLREYFSWIKAWLLDEI